MFGCGDASLQYYSSLCQFLGSPCSQQQPPHNNFYIGSLTLPSGTRTCCRWPCNRTPKRRLMIQQSNSVFTLAELSSKSRFSMLLLHHNHDLVPKLNQKETKSCSIHFMLTSSKGNVNPELLNIKFSELWGIGFLFLFFFFCILPVCISFQHSRLNRCSPQRRRRAVHA